MNLRAAVLTIVMAAACGGDDGDAPADVDAAPPEPPVANGTLGAWTPGPAMPVPRANHASVVLGDDLVVIGGNYRPVPGGAFVRTDRVDAATIAADGSLGAWRQMGTLSSAASEPCAAVWRDQLLVIGGLHDEPSDDSQVWAATRQPDGTLGAFTSLGHLPTGREAIGSEAYVAGDTLYVMSGTLPLDGDTLSVLITPLGAGPLAWREQVLAPMPGWRGQPMFAFTGNAFHALGGYLGGTVEVVADVQWARLAGGVLTPGPDEAPLPAPTAAGEVMAVDGYAFLVGGKPRINGSMGQSGVYVTPIAADGALGLWNPSTALPVGRTNHDLALGATHLYLTGGSFDMGGVDTVFSAQVRFAPGT